MRLIGLLLASLCVLSAAWVHADEPWIRKHDLLSYQEPVGRPAGAVRETDEDAAEVPDVERVSGEEGADSEFFVRDVADAKSIIAPADGKRLSSLEEKFDKLSKKFEAANAKKPTTYPTFKITGFIQIDSGWYFQDAKNIATVGDAQDGTNIRRARFATAGKAAEFTNYQLEVDFATAGRPSFFDTYAEQENIPWLGTVRVGQYLQPFSVDAMSGFRNLPFLERSLPFLAFVPFRRVGIMSTNLSEDERTTLAVSGFRTGGFNNAPLGDSRFATDFGDIGGYSFSTRSTHLVWYENEGCSLWHVGGGYDFSQLGANDAVGSGTPGNAGSPRPFYQARTGPEFGSLGYPENPSNFGSAVNGTPSFVDTGRYQASNFNLFGIETVYQNGPLSLQAEWMGTLVNSVAGPVFYNGAYGEVMYRLTGEHRQYDKKVGALRNPIPFQDFISVGRGAERGIHGWGAWEVGARWSFVNLTNPAKLDGHYYNSATNTFTGTANAGNGVLNDATLGVTWFLNQHAKLQFNWVCALLNNAQTGFSVADLYVTRVQVDF